MRIVLLLPKLHAGAELALNQILRNKKLHVVGIVRSDITPWTKSYWKYIRYGLRRAGLFYGALIGLTAILPFVGLSLGGLAWWRRKKQWLTIDQLVKKNHLNLCDTNNINSAETRRIIQSWTPDLIVSLSFDQILKNQTIQLAKVATLNMHPGLLPHYRGLWPEFWKLHNREKFAGVSIHHMNEKIDAGDVIAQMKFPIKKRDTKFSLALRSAQHGSHLLIHTLLKIQRGIHLPPLKLKGKARYYSLPGKKNFNLFYQRGKRLFSILGMWRELSRHL